MKCIYNHIDDYLYIKQKENEMKTFEEYALIYKALSDETRLKIVEMLSCGEMCACDILEFFNITQPTLSYHMKILTDCGLVNGRKDGLWMRYIANIELINEIKEFWERIINDKQNCICNNKRCSQCE